mgnify:CR=1 FL=1
MTATTQPSRQNGQEQLLTPGEVAALFRVDPKTVTRWATAGRIGSIRTPGGHRRFRESEVRTLLAELTSDVGRSSWAAGSHAPASPQQPPDWLAWKRTITARRAEVAR